MSLQAKQWNLFCIQTYCLQRDRTIMSDMLRGQAKMMDYDAICTFVFKDYKDFAKFMFELPAETVW